MFLRCLAAAGLLALLAGCAPQGPPVHVFKIGDKAEAGTLIYTILDAEWKAQAGGGESAKTPKQRFLIVRLAVTNSGAENVALPSLTLLDDKGREYYELVGEVDVERPLGLIRNLKPADTLEGTIVFDVEPKSYKLKLDGGAGSDRIAMVEMPLRFDEAKPVIPGVPH
jgi:hypothetical protein